MIGYGIGVIYGLIYINGCCYKEQRSIEEIDLLQKVNKDFLERNYDDLCNTLEIEFNNQNLSYNLIIKFANIAMKILENNLAKRYIEKVIYKKLNAENSYTVAYMCTKLNVFIDIAYIHAKYAVKNNPNDYLYLGTLGYIYYIKKDYDKSLKILLKANNLSESKDIVITYHLARVYLSISHNYFENSINYLNISHSLGDNDNASFVTMTEKIKELKNKQSEKMLSTLFTGIKPI